jgi:hypothetical protein
MPRSDFMCHGTPGALTLRLGSAGDSISDVSTDWAGAQGASCSHALSGLADGRRAAVSNSADCPKTAHTNLAFFTIRCFLYIQ